MRKSLFILAGCFLFFSVGAQTPQGPFQATAAQYGDINADPLDMMRENVVKIFKDGYWIAASFGNSVRPFRGCTGGRYSVKDGKYMEDVAFSSWDSTAANRQFVFDYTFSPGQFTQKGYVNSMKYPHHLVDEKYQQIVPAVPLKNNALEGVWYLESTVWDGDNPFSSKIEEVKIYAYPRFAWAQYNAVTNRFIGAGGGTYQYDGEQLIETVEYFTYEIALGTKFKVEVSMKPNGTMQQVSWDGRMVEIWSRVK
jgi:hypothetical protein